MRAPTPGEAPAQGDLADSLKQNELTDPLTGSSAGAPVQAASADGTPSPSSDHAGASPAAAGGGAPLPDHLRSHMESSFQADFSDVRVHRGPEAAQLGALAYTQGSDIHMRPDRYAPSTAGGKALLGHELAHVVQQRAGRVAAPQGKGAPINADAGLEREADVAGERASRNQRVSLAGVSGLALRAARSAAPGRSIQRRGARGTPVIQMAEGGRIIKPRVVVHDDQVVKDKTRLYRLARRSGRFSGVEDRLDTLEKVVAGDILEPIAGIKVSHLTQEYFRSMKRKKTGRTGAILADQVEDLPTHYARHKQDHASFTFTHWFMTIKDAALHQPIEGSVRPGPKVGKVPRNTKIQVDRDHVAKKGGDHYHAAQVGGKSVLVDLSLLSPLATGQLTGDQEDEAVDPLQDYAQQADDADDVTAKNELRRKAQRKADFKPGQIKVKGNYYAIELENNTHYKEGSVSPGDLVKVNYNLFKKIVGQNHVAIKILEPDGGYSPPYFIQEYKVGTMGMMEEIEEPEQSPKDKLEAFVEKGGKAFGWMGKSSGALTSIGSGTKRTFSTKIVDGNIEYKDSSEKSQTLQDFEHHAMGFDAFGGSVGMAQGIFGMAQGIFKFAKSKGVDRIEAGLDILSNTSKSFSSFTAMISKGIGHAKGSEDDKWAMARKVTGTITSVIDAVKTSVMTIIGLYKLIKNRKKSSKKGSQAAKLGVQLMNAVQSGLKVAQSFFVVLEKAVPLSLATSIPAVGIIINAANAAISFATAYVAAKQKKVMRGHEGTDLAKLEEAFGEDNLARMLVDDKRGVFGSRRVYKRFNPLMLARLEAHDWNTGDCTIRLTKSKTLVVTQAQYRLIKRYEFSSKLSEINQKRQVKGNIKAGSALVSMAADIANVTGVGAVVGGAIKAALMTGQLLYAGGRFVQQVHRNRKAKETKKALEQSVTSTKSLKAFKKEKHSTDKSSSTKEKEHRRHARFLFEMVANLPNAHAMQSAPNKTARLKIKNEYDSAQAYIKSTGVDMGMLYDQNGKPEAQYKMLVDAISSR